MRLFVALLPPDEALDDLDDAVAPRSEADERGDRELRWTDRHQWHVTLAFLGDVPERRLDDLTEGLGRVADRHGHLLVRLTGAGAFPNPYAARVLWAGVEILRGDLDRLVSGLRNASNAAGATPDGTHFHPHVTLGRFHRPTEATRWIRAFDAYEGPVWTASHVALVESHLGQGRGRRPRYEVHAELPLA
ncbi:MAG: RNA 2',3'-cyclic phosphodiesterase [Dermatophilaceae bacterium]